MQMLKTIAGAVAGLVVWIVVATLGNLLVRRLLPGYAEVEVAMTFTLSMMIARLLLGAVATLCAGFATAWLTKGNRRAILLLGLVLVAYFLPVHYYLLDRFPLWYHLVFLASLFPLTLLGARLFRSGSVDRRGATT